MNTEILKEKSKIYFVLDINEPSDPNTETIIETATLKIYKAHVKPELIMSNDFVDRSVRIEIFQIVIDNDNQQLFSRFLRRSIASRLVSLENIGWEEFDVSKAVQDWVRDPLTNNGLEVTCDSRYNMDDLIHFVTWNETSLRSRSDYSLFISATQFDSISYDPSLWPILNVLTQVRTIIPQRIKRSVDIINYYSSTDTIRNNAENVPEDCTVEESETRCCRYPIYFSFRDMNWDTWIIEPEGYMMYYCYGECPEGFKSASKYSDFISRVLANNAGLNVEMRKRMSVKCVPSELGPISIAHLNRDSVSIVSVLKNMIPLKCHCL